MIDESRERSDLLARPIWHALTGPHTHLGTVSGGAARYDAAVSPFAACQNDDPAEFSALAGMCEAGETIVLLQEAPPAKTPGFDLVSQRAGVQLAFAGHIAPLACRDDIVRLTDDDAPEMLALATLTAPGPFGARTHEFGRFWGIKQDGVLIAMAEERLRAGPWAEVSGVCTHPGHRGQGLAAALSIHVVAAMLSQGERPFLHSYADNLGAIRLYEGLGFHFARRVQAIVLVRA